MKPYTIINDDMLKALDAMDANSVDSIVTNPPYEIGFMGKGWDKTQIAFRKETRAKCLRVLKPGGYILAFNHSRTFHRMAVAIENAGFEIRDTIMWLYGSGFPKGNDIERTINKLDGVEYEEVPAGGVGFMKPDSKDWNVTKNQLIQKGKSSEQATQWKGWNTNLKPAYEPIIMARKPFKGSIANNVLTHGVGGINIDECRVDYNGETPNVGGRGEHTRGEGYGFKALGDEIEANTQGRYPANVIHDGSKEATHGMWDWETDSHASRYFYTAKASKKDRDEGLGEVEEKEIRGGGGRATTGYDDNDEEQQRLKGAAWKYGAVKTAKKNTHPTVKPTDLMQYLIRLVTPKGGTVLDPFMGSGSTGKAAMIENNTRNAEYHFIGIDNDTEHGYIDIAKARIEHGINYQENKAKETEDENQLSLFDLDTPTTTEKEKTNND